MNKKIEILLVLLGIVTLLGLSLAAWIYFSTQTDVNRYTQKQAELEENNSYLQQQLDAIEEKMRHWQEKSESLTAALNKLAKEHAHIQNQYTYLLKEKDSLMKEKEDLLKEKNSLVKGNKSLFKQLKELKQRDAQAQEKASDEAVSSLLAEKLTLQMEIEKLKEQLAGIGKQGQSLQDVIIQLQDEKNLLESKLKNIEQTSKGLNNDLLQERKKAAVLEADLTQAKAQLKNIAAEKDRLSGEFAKMKQVLEYRLAELDSMKEVLEGAVSEANKIVRKTEPISIQLPAIVVKADPVDSIADLHAQTPETQVPSRPRADKNQRKKAVKQEGQGLGLEGHILTVNHKHRFVVIDIGSDNKVKKGMNFEVYRRGKKVGIIEVIETRRNISACDIKKTNIKHLKANDIIRLLVI